MNRIPSRADSLPSARRRNSARRRSGAFTLIEMMAVVLIIGLLGTIVGTVVVQQIDRARVTTAKVQIKQLEAALDAYRIDNGRYPTTEQGLEALVQAPSSDPVPRNYPPGGYLRSGDVPDDPWGGPYQYESPGTRNSASFDLWSYGADGAPGGTDTDSDVGNWPAEG
jgi:general secretion pathway protein G